MFKRVMLFVGHALIFRKGHRRAGLILWMIIIGIASAMASSSRRALFTSERFISVSPCVEIQYHCTIPL